MFRFPFSFWNLKIWIGHYANMLKWWRWWRCCCWCCGADCFCVCVWILEEKIICLLRRPDWKRWTYPRVVVWYYSRYIRCFFGYFFSFSLSFLLLVMRPFLFSLLSMEIISHAKHMHDKLKPLLNVMIISLNIQYISSKMISLCYTKIWNNTYSLYKTDYTVLLFSSVYGLMMMCMNSSTGVITNQ